MQSFYTNAIVLGSKKGQYFILMCLYYYTKVKPIFFILLN